MVDDHPSQMDGYKSILNFSRYNESINITQCTNCEDAVSLIDNNIKLKKPIWDLVFLDYSLPPYQEKNINNGQDLGIYIKDIHKDIKILILTSHSEAFIIYDILKKLNPQGLLVKSDFSAENLIEAFETIVAGNTFYTESVVMAKESLLSKLSFLDNQDRQIIKLLSEGYQTKNLPSKLNLSKSAIEKRKANIKIYLGLDKGSDEDIILTARKLGFI